MKALEGNNIIKLILIVLVILFGVYVWPTPYRYISSGYPGRQNIITYDFLKEGEIPSQPYLKGNPFRINRITGIGEVWVEGKGWRKY
jgi:hypothetical protein